MDGGSTLTTEESQTSAQKALPLFSLSPAPFTEKKVVELDEYVDSLDRSDQWKPCFQRPTVRLEALRRSKLSSEVPVFRISINFEGRLDPLFVFNMYMNPELRSTWDDRVVTMAFREDAGAYLFYQHFLFNRPLADRDLLARCHVAPVEGGFKILFYSVKHRDYPEVREVERSKVYVSMYRFQMLGDVTTMHIIQQVDMHFSLLRVQQLVPLFLLNWAARFREECIKHLTS